jgi:branched-chain amino acid transport system substrate-binding protein
MKYGVPLLLLLICGGPLQAGPKAPPALPELRLAAIFADSGEAASYDRASVAIVRHLTAQHNQSADRRFQLHLLEFDTQSSALGARRAAKQAVQANAHLVIGTNWSALSMAMAPVLQQARIPMLSPASTQNELTRTGQYIFRLNYNNNVLGAAAATFARQYLKARTAVVLTNQSQIYSQQLTDVFVRQFRASGGTVLLTADYLRDTINFKPQLQQVSRMGADVLFVPGYGQDVGTIIRQLRALPSLLPVLCADGCMADMYRYAGKDLRYTFGLFYWHPDLPGMAQHPFRLWLRSQNIGHFNAAPLVYDAMQLVLHTAGQLNEFSAEAMRLALARLHNYPGITGNVSFNRQREPEKTVQALDLSDPAVHYLGPVVSQQQVQELKP